MLIDVELRESSKEISAWAREIEEAAKATPDEDYAKFLETLAEQKNASKEQVRRQMGLP